MHSLIPRLLFTSQEAAGSRKKSGNESFYETVSWWVPEQQLSTATMHDNSALVRVANVWKREKSKFMDALFFTIAHLRNLRKNEACCLEKRSDQFHPTCHFTGPVSYFRK